ncbi:hypothetical protein BaRGS_00039650 [Batillaria attramentaria]|uniref:CUB domain-containing protein n=1 Tax=Batillaria attramentaria TaxID=370345 RepID=A0ABD0J2L5_9CAEN
MRDSMPRETVFFHLLALVVVFIVLCTVSMGNGRIDTTDSHSDKNTSKCENITKCKSVTFLDNSGDDQNRSWQGVGFSTYFSTGNGSALMGDSPVTTSTLYHKFTSVAKEGTVSSQNDELIFWTPSPARDDNLNISNHEKPLGIRTTRNRKFSDRPQQELRSAEQKSPSTSLTLKGETVHTPRATSDVLQNTYSTRSQHSLNGPQDNIGLQNSQHNDPGVSSLSSTEATDSPHVVYKSVRLRSREISECLLLDGHMHIKASDLYIRAVLRSDDTMNAELGETEQNYFYCNITVSVPAGKTVKATIKTINTTLQLLSVRLTEGDRVLFDSIASNHARTNVVSFSRSVTLQITLVRFDVSAVVLMADMVAVTNITRSQLQLEHVSATSGFIQTPKTHLGFYPKNMDSWLRLEVPADHVVMLSVNEMDIDMTHKHSNDCKGDIFKLYLERNRSKTLLWELCHRELPAPIVLEAEFLHAHFISDSLENRETEKGARLTFTFHNVTARPSRVEPSGKWNCSVPFWADFRQHLPCNLVPDCVHSEDEMACPYTTDECGPGFIMAGGSCFIFLTHEKKISWEDAADECRKRDAYLAILHTEGEWEELTESLSVRNSKLDLEGTLIGLRSLESFAPDM